MKNHEERIRAVEMEQERLRGVVAQQAKLIERMNETLVEALHALHDKEMGVERVTVDSAEVVVPSEAQVST